jgi:GrpB-like predicted nucleotidyltransferase (UPF0157 family)
VSDAPLGLERGVVRLVPHDPRWATLFLEESARLQPLLPRGVTLEHIGSTAVPGLAAKPVLDILAGYESVATLPACIAALVAAGYLHRGEQGIPGREFFRRGEPRAYHVHLALRGGSFWNAHLAFRDALRADAAVREAYARLKQQLAACYPRDRAAYIEGKGSFVREVLRRVGSST